ncbi:MAG: threonylcarbamoyl-AMP synthase [candidate division Zixibacteria bacterium]|nr:threonylcarbamoyl-AMP synthase [Candidatus Tariuqbacter arcticus]
MFTAEHNSLIDGAVQFLRRGGVIAFPTDTVYGLGVDPHDDKAVKRLFEIKVRSKGKAVPLMIRGAGDLNLVAESIPASAKLLIKKHWPGPLTIVLSKSEKVSPLISGGKGTVAVRCPDHPIALGILVRFGRPLAVTSANISGEEALCAFEEVSVEFSSKVDLIVPGEVRYKIVSTVVDFTVEPPVVLREGALKIEV